VIYCAFVWHSFALAKSVVFSKENNSVDNIILNLMSNTKYLSVGRI